MTTHNESGPQGGDSTHASQPPATGTSGFLRSRWRMLLWILLIGTLVYVQWPFLKGLYYRSTATPAAAVAWRTDFDAALAEAAQTNKPVLLDFTADWCPPCQVMKHEVWPDAEVGRAVADSFIPVLIDVDDPKNAQVTRRYAVQSIPTVLVIDAEGQVLQRATFLSKDAMLAFLTAGA